MLRHQQIDFAGYRLPFIWIESSSSFPPNNSSRILSFVAYSSFGLCFANFNASVKHSSLNTELLNNILLICCISIFHIIHMLCFLPLKINFRLKLTQLSWILNFLCVRRQSNWVEFNFHLAIILNKNIPLFTN